MVQSTNLGFPRIGPQRELKFAVESYWAGEINEQDLHNVALNVQKHIWTTQKAAGLSLIPSNDFSFYDQVLDTAALVGAVPERFGWTGGPVSLDTYFAMARGAQGDGGGIPAMEMTKWFDTNYHYIVPELAADQKFQLTGDKPIQAFKDGLAIGIRTKPVLIGPLTFLLLSKSHDDGFDTLSLLDRLLPVYAELLEKLREAGAEWVQLDEPALVLDLSPGERVAYAKAYEQLAKAVPDLNLLVATYFGDLGDNLATALQLPVSGLHLDLTLQSRSLENALALGVPENLSLSLGVVDGRNVWKTDLRAAVNVVTRVVDALGKNRVFVAPSCSLLHVPVDLRFETNLDPELKSWVAFAVQKLEETTVIARAASSGVEAVADALEASDETVRVRRESSRIHRPEVAARVGAVTADDTKRENGYALRAEKQSQRLNLPIIPTTTIGSFPQTRDVRQARSQVRTGKITEQQYDAFIADRVREAVDIQETIGLDVLVHGEFERNDMVEYFGELLGGFAVTASGWVQSYGTRCVKPPIIYGDVHRAKPMTVKWSSFAQSLTDKPVKGMLTGPVTILQWSFVRDDQPRELTCRQIALALRDEVLDLESAGLAIVQVDEPALREGLPLRRGDWEAYLRWAVDCFKLATAGVKDETQIHTHMCYSEFNDIIDWIAALDADVISIEASRSNMDLLDAFTNFQYPNEIGPGVYDIHSPRVPTVEEMVKHLEKALQVVAPRQLWANPDCGLKTRGWEEVKQSLTNLVQAAHHVRKNALPLSS